MENSFLVVVIISLIAIVSSDLPSINQIESVHVQQPSAPPLYGSWSSTSNEPSTPGVGVDPAFAVQTGYEGYLVDLPDSLSIKPTDSLLSTLFSNFALKLASKVGLWFAGFILLVLLGAAFTTGICAFTPICTISFLGTGFSSEHMRSYLTPDRLTAVTSFVTEAIEKYKDLQKKPTHVK